jgi:hypothetical protein
MSTPKLHRLQALRLGSYLKPAFFFWYYMCSQMASLVGDTGISESIHHSTQSGITSRRSVCGHPRVLTTPGMAYAKSSFCQLHRPEPYCPWPAQCVCIIQYGAIHSPCLLGASTKPPTPPTAAASPAPEPPAVVLSLDLMPGWMTPNVALCLFK